MKLLIKFSFVLSIFSVIFSSQLQAGLKSAEDYGFKHIQTIFRSDTINILIKSKKGDENIRKPILLFCQGSLPQPLIKVAEEGIYNVFPFRTDSLEEKYHLVIISKPYVPLIADASKLNPDMTYCEPETKRFPKGYSDRNYLDYYVDRNIEVLKYLRKLNSIDGSKLIVAGHSEGSTIAAKIAMKYNKVTHLIYASGNPLGRIQTIINQYRAKETETDSTRYAENYFDYWKQVVDEKNSLDDTYGDTYKATYDFSYPPINYLKKLKIPVLVCYGTKDLSSPFNDYLRIEMIRQHKTNFTFKAYIGLEHNFFEVSATGQIDYDKFNWDRVASDWLNWTLL